MVGGCAARAACPCHVLAKHDPPGAQLNGMVMCGNPMYCVAAAACRASVTVAVAGLPFSAGGALGAVAQQGWWLDVVDAHGVSLLAEVGGGEGGAAAHRSLAVLQTLYCTGTPSRLDTSLVMLVH